MIEIKSRNLYLVTKKVSKNTDKIDPIRSEDVANLMAYHLATEIMDDSEKALKAQANQQKRVVFDLLS
jgi:hypothetical protein